MTQLQLDRPEICTCFKRTFTISLFVHSYTYSLNINGMIGTYLGAKDIVVEKTRSLFARREIQLKKVIHMHIYIYAYIYVYT